MPCETDAGREARARARRSGLSRALALAMLAQVAASQAWLGIALLRAGGGAIS